MIIAGLVLGLLAAALHAYIFVLESFAWTTPRARAIFGTTEEEARATRQLAFNQGFYNLFLGLIAAAGAVMTLAGATAAGAALLVAGLGAMLLAASVLFATAPAQRAAAAKQGALPLLALILLLLGVIG
ncbi:DUF1304 domain-containing protein [Rothia sp. AR01]|uniref:DUF1304 domain-containing protein n=2 Tax=Rothia santali TaxID=2949643 RepID=A0A9X2KLH8_9MICC|nr:DUF1304 domain-containing protein [Rothia santali]